MTSPSPSSDQGGADGYATPPPSSPSGTRNVAAAASQGVGQSAVITVSATEDQAANRKVAFDPDQQPDKLLALFPDGVGQSQTTMDELGLLIGQRQVFTDLRTLETRLNESKRPTANIVDRYSTQSDHVDINQLEISQDIFFAEGRDHLRMGIQRIDYTAAGPNDVRQYAIGGTGNVKSSEVVALTGEAWLSSVEVARRRHTMVTYDVFLTLRPSDAVRIDLDTSRRTFDNIRSLQLGLTAQSWGASVDVMPAYGLRLTARGSLASYSDDNERRSEEIEAVYRVGGSPIIEIGVRGTNFHFSKLLNNGYFNPRNYYSGEAMVRLQSELSQKLTVQLAGSGGIERVQPGDTKPLIKGSLQAVYRLYKGWVIDGEISHFTSRASNSSGFARTSFTVGLHYRF